MRTQFFGLAAVAVILQISLGCASLPDSLKPQVVGVTPRVTSLDLSGIDLTFDLDVSNPYFTAIKTPDFNYDFSVAGMGFASDAATAKVDLPARSTGTVSLPIHINFADLLGLSQNLKGANEAPYSIGGNFLIPAGGQQFEIPFSHEGTFPVLKIPEFSNIQVDTGGISLSGTSLDIQADMLNPNIFEIGLAGLGYSLELGDIKLGEITARTSETLAPGASGGLSLSGKLSAKDALKGLTGGGKLGGVRIVPRGKLQTPYGDANLGD